MSKEKGAEIRYQGSEAQGSRLKAKGSWFRAEAQGAGISEQIRGSRD